MYYGDFFAATAVHRGKSCINVAFFAEKIWQMLLAVKWGGGGGETPELTHAAAASLSWAVVLPPPLPRVVLAPEVRRQRGLGEPW